MQKPLIGVTTSFTDPARLDQQNVNPFYLEAVEASGGTPKILDFLTPLSQLPGVLSELDGVLLIGGGDIDPALYGAEADPLCGAPCPVKDRYEIALTQQAYERGIPVLGICRGAQVVNVALGGTLIQHVPDACGVVHQQKSGNVFWHDVTVQRGTLLHSLVGQDVIATNSYHHQAALTVAQALTVGALSREGIVEALESRPDAPGWILALQWHPERTYRHDPFSRRYFDALIREAQKTRQ